MKKKFFTLVSLLCMAIVSAFAQSTTTERFYLGITGYDGSTPATASFTVFEAFNFVAELPAVGNDKIGANKATVDVRMTDIPSLNVVGKKTYTNTFETATLTKSELSEWIPSAYNFKGVTAPVTVLDDNGSDTFTYNISATTDYKITGTPDSYALADAAWTRLTSHVESGDADKDSRVIVPAGAYFQIGTEKLTFNSEAIVCEADWNFGDATSTIEAAATLEEGVATGADTYKAIAYLPAGTALYLGGMYALLKDKCVVTVDCSNYYDSSKSDYTFGLKALKDASSNRERIELLLGMFDDCMAIIGGAGNVPVLVDFTDKQPILTVYPGSADAMYDQTVDQFLETRKTAPNAVAYTTAEHAAEVEGVDNVVIEYEVGAVGNKYYECANLILEDKKDFYTPNDFIAVAGNYTRVPAAATYPEASYNSFCLPFSFKGADLSSSAQILTFSFYEEKDGHRNAYFNEIDAINAGNPCVVNDLGTTWAPLEFNNTNIVALPDNDGNMKGTFVKTTDFAEGNYYCVVPQENKFGPLSNTLTAFRSVLSLDEGVIIPTNAKDQYINIVVLDPTAISEVKVEANEEGACYAISGQRVANNYKGIVVKNGKKFIVK